MKVFVVNIEDARHQVSLESLFEWASEERKRRARKYLKRDDQWRCLIGGFLIMHMLRTETGDIKEYQMQCDSMGRPFVHTHKAIDFNISHSNQWVAGVIASRRVGIDIEYIAGAGKNIAHRFYSEEEKEYCRKNPENFYQIWTLKESFLKAKGTGLSVPLNSFSVISDGKPLLTENGAVSKEYAFYSRKLGTDYFLSVCAKADSIEGMILSELNIGQLKEWGKG